MRSETIYLAVLIAAFVLAFIVTLQAVVWRSLPHVYGAAGLWIAFLLLLWWDARF